jgi:hypothetical protein
MLIDNINLADIYEFVETGNPDNAPEGIVAYLELLNKVYGMTLRIDKFGSKEMVVRHLVLSEKISRYKAAQVYNEAIEYFYNDTEVSKKAWRNFYASIMDKEINFAMLTQKDGSDAKRIVDMAEKAANMRGAFDEEIEELPEELFRNPFIVYTCDAEMLGLPKVDRNKLAAQIDAYPEITEKEKVQIKREAQILPIKMFQNEQEDARKS